MHFLYFYLSVPIGLGLGKSGYYLHHLAIFLPNSYFSSQSDKLLKMVMVVVKYESLTFVPRLEVSVFFSKSHTTNASK